MIVVKLKFSGDDKPNQFEVESGELLLEAIERTTKEIPRVEVTTQQMFIVLVNGQIIAPEFWDKVKLETKDSVLITPNFMSGESGQMFKQILLIVIVAVASYYFPPAASLGNALLVAGITIGATLALNALIPPPVPSLGDLGGIGIGGPESSQTYTISGQSNQMRRLGSVPKIYGSHRMFPTLGANPYTELAVDPATGEVIQYLNAIFDFGLGSPLISDLRIGDTLLDTSSFQDFEYNFVDPNRPDTPADEFDERLDKAFSLYRGDRTVQSLSIGLIDGQSNIQNTDENPKEFPQEIIIDMVCPRGLYGFSSSGDRGDRRINLVIEFAPIDSSDFKAYNDLSAVNGFRGVGGTDFTDFKINPVGFFPADPEFFTYYAQYPRGGNSGSNNNNNNRWDQAYFRLGGNRVPLPKPGPNDNWEINTGTKIMAGSRLLGIIQTITDMGSYYNVLLDRAITDRYDLFVYEYQGFYKTTTPNTPPVYSGNLRGRMTLTASRHTIGAATIEASSTNPVYSSFRFTPKAIGQFKVRIRRVSTDGFFTRTTGEDLTWGALTTAFTNPPVKTTKRHVFMELRIRATNQLNGTIQNLSAIASQPIDIYDPDTQTWTRGITNNPAWVFCDLLTGEVNKKAVPKSRLHLDSILAWAAYCDEVPTPPPDQEYIEPRFQCNFILDYEATLQEVLGSVGGAAQASLNIIDGKYGVLVDRLKTVPVQIFTPRNSSNFSANRFYAPRPHGVKVKFIDPNLAWEVSESIVYDNGFNEENATEFDELTSFACTNFEQAWRFGRYMIAQNRLRQETISMSVDFENLVCTRGDYVQITQDVMQVGGRPARVKAVDGTTVFIDDSLDIDPDLSYGYVYRSKTGVIATFTLTVLSASSFQLDGDMPEVGDLIVIGEVGRLVLDCIVKSIQPNDDLSAQVTLVERANEIFDYESESELPEYDPQLSQTSNPDFKAPKAVIDLTLGDVTWECAETQSGYQFYAEIVWDIPVGSIYEFFEIWYNNGSGYRNVATTTSKFWKQILDQSRIGGQMGLKVVAVSAGGRKLNLIEMPEVTFATARKTTPPSDVQGFGLSITDQVLQIAWQSITDCDVYRYEVRYSPEVNDVWEASVPLQIVDRNVNSISVQARTGVYFIKAVDFAGNKSTNASQAITTIPNLFNLNIIETLNDAPDFEGLKEQVEKLGDAIVLQERVSGDVDTMQFYSDGYYLVQGLVDLGEIYSARLQSLIRADGYRFGELMSEWEHLSEVEHLSSADTDDWDVVAEYRVTTEILSMASWAHLSDVEHLNEGLGQGFTPWRPIPTIGDATGRAFQFRIHLRSITPNVTPRLFDGTIKIDMPDRTESFENLSSHASDPTQVTYSQKFTGPDPSPNIQISVDGAESGDYWQFENRNLEGFQIRFFDRDDVQVVRQFDVFVKGFGRRHVVTI